MHDKGGNKEEWQTLKESQDNRLERKNSSSCLFAVVQITAKPTRPRGESTFLHLIVRPWIPVPLFQMASATAADLAGPAFTNPPYSSICPTQATLSQLVATVWNWELNPSRSLETSLRGPWPGFKYLANSLIGHFCVTQTLFWSQIKQLYHLLKFFVSSVACMYSKMDTFTFTRHNMQSKFLR